MEGVTHTTEVTYILYGTTNEEVYTTRYQSKVCVRGLSPGAGGGASIVVASIIVETLVETDEGGGVMKKDCFCQASAASAAPVAVTAIISAAAVSPACASLVLRVASACSGDT